MRGDEETYRRPVRNGSGRPAHDRFNDHLADQSSLSDFNSSEPAFELDHLATFAAGGPRRGTMHVEDGLRKLRQMENTTGIWTMRCILLVERRFIVILDKNSGEELERFPVQFIHEPTAIFKNDRREIYNNLILFTVMDENNRRDPQADMHIFQSVRTPAQNIVDEIFASKRGQSRVSSAGEAELSDILKQCAIETQIEVQTELDKLSSAPPFDFEVASTSDQFVWKWDADSVRSGVESASTQQALDATTHMTSRVESVSTQQALDATTRMAGVDSVSRHQALDAAKRTTSAVDSVSRHQALDAAKRTTSAVDSVSRHQALDAATTSLTSEHHAHSHNKDARSGFTASQQTAALSHIMAKGGEQDGYAARRRVGAGGGYDRPGDERHRVLSEAPTQAGALARTFRDELVSGGAYHSSEARTGGVRGAVEAPSSPGRSEGEEDTYRRADRLRASSGRGHDWSEHRHTTTATANDRADLYSQVNKHTHSYTTAAVSENQRATAANAAGQIGGDGEGSREAADLYSSTARASWHQRRSAATANQNASNEHVSRTRANERAEGTDHEGYKIPPPPSGPAPEPPGSRDPYDMGGFRESIEQRQYQFNSSRYGSSQFHNGGGFIGGGQRSSMMARPNYLPYREREDEVGSNELLERDVVVEGRTTSTITTTSIQGKGKNDEFSLSLDQQLLNHCFDDIEKFVARLQQAAEAYKELERRKKERGGKGKKGPIGGAGMLAHRARPPPAVDFVDIFQKFKLSFNLLAKLKAHIHDPNAPELVHFLFTPLSLIYEASRDPIHGSLNLGDQAMAPVLTQDAKQLLLNCLTSKEIELWQALGKHWTTSKEEWKGYIPPYVPRFYDGWEPAPTLVDEPSSRSTYDDHRSQRTIEPDRPSNYVPVKPMPFPDEDPYQRERVHEYRDHEFERDPTPTRNIMNSSSVTHHQYTEQRTEPRRRAPEPVVQREPPVSQSLPPQESDNFAYLQELKRGGSLAYEVLHDRQGKNSKELTVNKGDYLLVLDNSRNWWKVRNYKGETGYCPYTILKQVNGDNNREASNASVDQAAKKSSASSRESFTADRAPPHAKENPGPPASRYEDVLIPTLELEEEESERHAFRPVEPPQYVNRGPMEIRRTQPELDLHNELRSKMGMAQMQRRGGGGGGSGGGGGGHEMLHPAYDSYQHSSMMGAESFYITRGSSHSDVSAWLHMKGFSTLCRRALQGFTGQDLFSLHRNEMEELIGHEEAARLEGQITLQKKMTGYKTQTAAELNAIFQKRRARTDQQGVPLGQPPDFRPLTPSSYDGPDSDSDNEDRQLADTGKTLRDLLVRQRQKIVGSSIFDQQ